jgi:hypothetical protein
LRKLPFGKALLYFAVVQCRIDFEQPSFIEFLQSINEYFPFLNIDSPFTYVQDRLNTIPNIPATIMKGNYKKPALEKFIKEAGLVNLHDLIEKDQFKDLLYDTDLRRKIEGMAITGFRPIEIELEIKQRIQDIDIVTVKTYLDCFCDYSTMDFIEKKNFINQTFEELSERKALLKCLDTKSRDAIRGYLSLSTKTYNHIEIVNKRAHEITLKIQEALIDGNEVQYLALSKLSLNIADALYKFGVGNDDAAKQLLDALAKKPEDVGVVSPKPMHVDQLEDLYLENQKSPSSPLTES